MNRRVSNRRLPILVIGAAAVFFAAAACSISATAPTPTPAPAETVNAAEVDSGNGNMVITPPHPGVDAGDVDSATKPINAAEVGPADCPNNFIDGKVDPHFPKSGCTNGPGISTCGEMGDQPCYSSAVIPAATWNRRGDPNFPATVASFRLDKYEVTVGRFRQFVQANEGTAAHTPAYADGYGAVPGDTAGGWKQSFKTNLVADKAALEAILSSDNDFPAQTTYDKSDATLPIGNLTFAEALLFCAWDGGFLPTEAMWLSEAEAGSDNRIFSIKPNLADGGRPQDPTGAEQNTCQSFTGENLGGACNDVPMIPSPVWTGSGASKNGLLHLNGNLFEPFQDFGGRVTVLLADGGTELVRAPMTMPCTSGINGCPTSSDQFLGGTLTRRVTSGGMYLFPANFYTTDDAGAPTFLGYGLGTNRNRTGALNAVFRSLQLGVRCARSL